MRLKAIKGPGHAAFAAALTGLGILGLVKGDPTPIWSGLPATMPFKTALGYVCATVTLGTGLGLLWPRSALVAARVLAVSFALWLLLVRVPPFFYAKPLLLVWWSFGQSSALLAPALVLATGERGLRVARTAFGLALIPFGLAHFAYLQATTVLIPDWLPWHDAWAYFTGAAFIAAGVGMITGIYGRLAANLITLQIGLFTLIVWLPRVVANTLTPFQWGEWVVSIALTGAAWVMADSYRGQPFLKARGNTATTIAAQSA